MININSNFLRDYNYDCKLHTNNDILEIKSGDKKVDIVSKESLGFFKKIRNSLKSLVNKNKWTSITVLNDKNKKVKIYVNIASIKDKLKTDYNNADDLSFKTNINEWLINKTSKSDSKRIKYDNIGKLKNDINCVNNKILNSEHQIDGKIDGISKKDLDILFKYIDDNKETWQRELVKNKRSSMLIKNGEGHVRTIRVNKDGGIFIILKTTIGKGSSKKARLAIDYKDKKLMAYVRGVVHTEYDRLDLLNDFCSPVKHKHVAKQSSMLMYSQQIDNFDIEKISVIMPFFNEIDMMKVKENTLTSKQKKGIILDACMGLEAIHKKNLIHRDIKPENIFIKSKKNKKTGERVYSAQVGDFGLVSKQQDVGEFAGTPHYIAPELWAEYAQLHNRSPAKGTSIITRASDCYSMGLTIAEFLNIPTTEVQGDDKNGRELIVKNPKKGTPEYLISKLLERDPKKRLTMKQAIALAKKTNF